VIIEEVRKKVEEEAIVNETYELGEIGCVDHNQEIVKKLFELTVIYALDIFCKNINDLLAGKIKILPPNANPIQDLARDYYIKKTMRKHSDKMTK